VIRSRTALIGALLVSFLAGLFSHVLYLRWTSPEPFATGSSDEALVTANSEPAQHLVKFVPLPTVPEKTAAELPLLAAREVDKIRALADREVRIRGRIFRVGYATKSNTYFLNFGPTREALTAVIFNSAVELFERSKQPPKNFENREVEISGLIKNHPQYGLEVILENPQQIRIVN
jgi:hypothetical protein